MDNIKKWKFEKRLYERLGIKYVRYFMQNIVIYYCLIVENIFSKNNRKMSRSDIYYTLDDYSLEFCAKHLRLRYRYFRNHLIIDILLISFILILNFTNLDYNVVKIFNISYIPLLVMDICNVFLQRYHIVRLQLILNYNGLRKTKKCSLLQIVNVI